MLNCICSNEWLLSYNVKETYIAGNTLTHSEECESHFQEQIKEHRDYTLLERWKWVTATENCGHPYSHGPHGSCSGRAFDRT